MVTGVGTDPHIELAQAAQCGDYNMLDTIMSFGEVTPSLTLALGLMIFGD